MPYSDYPKAASEQARRALAHRDQKGSSCGTQVGWQRANQLANREAISEETVKRTYSFLSRAKTYDKGDFTDADGKEICGSIMYAAWGGDPTLRWASAIVKNLAENKSAMSDNLESRHIESISEDEDSITITFRKPSAVEPEANSDKGKKKYRAEPGEVGVGDFVSWDSSGGRAYGRITEISDDDTLISDSGFEVTGTMDDPAALISVYELNEEDGVFTERDPVLIVAHKFTSLTPEPESDFRNSNKIEVEYRFKPAKEVQGISTVERRTYHAELRMDVKTGKPTIRGYAAVFESDSELLGGSFIERIAPTAFDNADMSDVRALFNHDPNFVLGRTTNNTLKLDIDERGLRYTITPPDTQLVRDLVIEPMRRGDISQSSFGFTLIDDEWDESGEYPVRTLKRIGEVMDISPVTFPAYTQTEASARSIEKRCMARAEKEKKDKRSRLAGRILHLRNLPEGDE